MPALAWEIEAALAEGVRLETLAAPVRIRGQGGRVVAVDALRMRLGPPDASGRPRPVPLEGSEFVLECDTAIPAIGQQPLAWAPGPQPRIKLKKQGLFAVQPGSFATSWPGVFAGGDAVSGPATAIDAVAAGIGAAQEIERYLEERHLYAVERTDQVVARPEAAVLARVERSERLVMAERAASHRKRTFAEVERGYSQDQARAEAARCLNCASCCECRECERACGAEAVDHGRPDELIELQVAGCVVATGFDPAQAAPLEEYGGGEIADVVTGLEFERLLSASGPTGGQVLRPSDGAPARRIAFVQCAGSRDVRHRAYCSAVCCMHATKEAILAREHDPGVESTIFFMDLRATGKGFQEYVQRARDEYGVRFVRARPARVVEDEESGQVQVIYEDTRARTRHAEPFDLVVLGQALVPAEKSLALARVLGLELDEHGFFPGGDPLAAPLDTPRPGVLVAGCAGGPRDIPESVVQASAAAARIAELLGPPAKRSGHGR
jgi:heterodisulfide reductase subunit A-like polyferredoxin